MPDFLLRIIEWGFGIILCESYQLEVNQFNL